MRSQKCFDSKETYKISLKTVGTYNYVSTGMEL